MRFAFKNLLDDTLTGVEAISAFYCTDTHELTLVTGSSDSAGYDANIFGLTEEEADRSILSAVKEGYVLLNSYHGIQDYERYTNYSEWHGGQEGNDELKEDPEVITKLEELGYYTEPNEATVKNMSMFKD